MLSKICDGSLESPFVLFVDNSNHKGNALFKAVLKSFLKESSHEVHVFCWSASTLRLLQDSEMNKNRIKVYNCFADSKGWINPVNKITSLQYLVKEALTGSAEGFSIVIDSLSDMLFTFGFGQCVQDLISLKRQLSRRNGAPLQILSMVHADVLPSGAKTLSFVEHLPNTIITVVSNMVQITHRKPGGHITKKNEKFLISPEGSLRILENEETNRTACCEENSSLLPQDIASFRVGLNEKERKDRNRLVLPYTRSQDNSGGNVFYHPDSVDDWDDEDPDDDLDI